MKLSIIVPIYGVEAYLGRCIDSILNQTFEDYEVILVDDGSPDGCGEICDEYARRDSRVRVIHKENGGRSDARNTGLDAVRGEYIGFVDSDDSIDSNMYQRMLEMAELYDAQIVSCGWLELDQEGGNLGHWPNLTEDRVYTREDFINNLYPNVRTDFTPSLCNKIFRREVFHNVRFPLGKIYEDAFVQLPLLDRCEKMVVCHEHFYNYYIRSDSIMNTHYIPQCMDMIDFAWDNYRFYVEKNLKNQQDYTLATYANNYMKNYFEVMLSHRELQTRLRPYTEQFKALMPQIVANPQICRLKRLAIRMMFVAPRLAKKLCTRYFPECLWR